MTNIAPQMVLRQHADVLLTKERRVYIVEARAGHRLGRSTTEAMRRTTGSAGCMNWRFTSTAESGVIFTGRTDDE